MGKAEKDTGYILDLFKNLKGAMMAAWKRKKRQQMPRRFFLSGCAG
jgi:hypothetical protein